jgi:hypothetical protein
MRKFLAAAGALIVVSISPAALAGPAGDAVTQRISIIAQGDIDALTAEYAPAARLHWVGGPLNGVYEGIALAEPWRRFFAAMGALQASIGPITESANPDGATVIAPIVFTGVRDVKVRYVAVYRNGQLVDEIWQVDPQLVRSW